MIIDWLLDVIPVLVVRPSGYVYQGSPEIPIDNKLPEEKVPISEEPDRHSGQDYMHLAFKFKVRTVFSKPLFRVQKVIVGSRTSWGVQRCPGNKMLILE